jgi:hypothetical protein
MARMIPSEPPSDRATAGELLLYRYLRDLLPESFRVFFEPSIPSRRSGGTVNPDFLIFGPDFGLLVLEVKDWSLDQIVKVEANKVYLRQGIAASEGVAHDLPAAQAKRYQYEVMDHLKRERVLVHPDGDHAGHLCFPIGYAVALTRVASEELRRSGLDAVFSPVETLCKDQLDAVWIERNELGARRMLDRYLKRFAFDDLNLQQSGAVERSLAPVWTPKLGKAVPMAPPPAPAAPIPPPAPAPRAKPARPLPVLELTEDQSRTVHGSLVPEAVFRRRSATEKSVPLGMTLQKSAEVLDVMTAAQERLVHTLGGGNRIIYGVAGSGKTIVLLERAKLHARKNPDSRILFLCYNNSLCSYLKHKLDGYPTVEIDTFVRWALRRYLTDEQRKTANEARLTSLLAQKPARDAKRYDAIFVDEAHDFEPEWFQAAVSALHGGADGDLTIAVDGSQSVYKRNKPTSWASVGIKARGRVEGLVDNYRNTQEIFQLAWQLTQNPVAADSPEGPQLRLQPHALKRSGAQPQYFDTTRFAGEAESIARVIECWKSTTGLKNREIAVVSANLQVTIKLIERVEAILKSRKKNISFAAASTGGRKRSVMQKDSIPLLSFASSKGLEFPAVLITGLERYSRIDRGTFDANLLYVALTRATSELVLTWNGPCLISQLFDVAPFRDLAMPLLLPEPKNHRTPSLAAAT